MLTRIRSAIYPVRDLAVAKRFYTALLGIEPYFDQPFYVGYDVGGFELGLDPDVSQFAPSTSGGVPFWLVGDIQAAYKRCVELGGTGSEDPHETGDGIWVAKVTDPSGNLLGLIFDPSAK